MAGKIFLLTFLILSTLPKMAESHGRLIEPPSRSTMWRFGFNNPPNYNDNQLNCGGYGTQYNLNEGKCGVCGDQYDVFPRPNEGPSGTYAKNGLIVRKYEVGQIIQTSVDITANHKGWFQFRLCQNDEKGKTVTQDCFDKHLLSDLRGNTTLYIGHNPALYNHSLRLPGGLQCKNCVLQWRYHAGNSWGVDRDTGEGCMGCGDQEEFYGCADIAIGAKDVQVAPSDGPKNLPPIPDNGQSGYDNNDQNRQASQNDQNKCSCLCSNEAISLFKSFDLWLLLLFYSALPYFCLV